MDVLRAHPEFIGTHPKTDGEGGLPVLIKFIDAARDLSVQVHPSDEYARKHEHGQLGKTEMWYVLEAAPGASLVYGFRQDLTRAMLAASLACHRCGRDDRGDPGELEPFLPDV